MIMLALWSSVAHAGGLQATELRPGVTQVLADTALTEVMLSPDGLHVAIQAEHTFVVAPVSQLKPGLAARSIDGRVMGFLPSGALLFAETQVWTFNVETGTRDWKHANGPVWTLDPDTGERTQVLPEDTLLTPRNIAIVSDSLAIGADGYAPPVAMPGNFLRIDLQAGSLTRGAVSTGFGYPAVSESKRFVAYEFGSDMGNDTHIYDVISDVDHAVALDDMQFPLAWVGGDRLLINTVVQGPNGGPGEEPAESWLRLFDATTQETVWKVQGDIFPTRLAVISGGRVVFLREHQGYVLSVADGAIHPLKGLNGYAVSTDATGSRLAVMDFRGPDNGPHHIRAPYSIAVGPVEGPYTTVLELPDWHFMDSYKGMGERAPVWTPDGRRLLILGTDRFLVVDLEAPSPRPR